MNRRSLYILFALILTVTALNGQSNKQQFNQLLQNGDTLKQRQLLVQWEKDAPQDAELYVAYFNYYFQMSEEEIVSIGQEADGELALEIMDLDSSKKNPVAYMYSNIHYNEEFLEKGMNWIDDGIQQYPNRLDMRFGKIYVLGKLEEYTLFTKEIIQTVEYSSKNENNWTWTDNTALKDPLEFMLGTIQNYQIQLFNTEDDRLLENMQQIATSILTYYPENIESLSNSAIVYLLQEKYIQALSILQKAEKINPKDCIVLNNIAVCYENQGNQKMAKKYYQLVIKNGNKEEKKDARNKLKNL